MKTQQLATITWSGDDGPKSYAFLAKKIKEAYECGGRVIRIGSNSVQVMTMENMSSGTFIFFLQ